MIPSIEKNFVPFGIYEDLDPVIKSNKFFPVYITGLSGNGKSTTAEQLCAKHGRNLIKINFNNMVDEEQIIGSKTLIDGNVEIVDGPVIIALKEGSILLIEEIDAGHPNLIMCLQTILEGKPYYYKLKNEWVFPKEGFNIIATANTKGKGSDNGEFIGTNILNEAFLERFAITLEQKYPPFDVEFDIITKRMKEEDCLNEQFAMHLIQWAAAIRKTYDEGGVVENISTRRLIHIVTAYSLYKDETKAVQLAINRFDIATKNSFLDLYMKRANK